ncbi:hypothetical protein ACWT_1869 [Actinoplanes sp. SE50]|uniref:hypothetical protein n=1 Tax=unclassified Actinoplanes TaxID=2626549 RepID=UPI00023EBCDE|nr:MULTISPECIES: hypothetical protein [unclassified Actinoplanes]AEV82888.1 hypothetical protein ACPL_1991 [Actinoplanes sp. SE50/110]ATO81284.1 hypothetical protein ACWT_1869 [Actinoplanes sp. SE50]SLL98691.1 hypothetical protein ACSP50_1918 [Actinoplanes sp. SE50/110]
MSLSSMAEDSALRLQGTPGVSPKAAAATAAAVTAEEMVKGAPPDDAKTAGENAARLSAGTSVTGSVLTQLVKYVPTETISVYLAVQAALGTVAAPPGHPECEADFTSRWVWLLLLAVATVLLTIGLAYRSQKQVAPTARFKVPLVEPAAATAAYLVWALSLPTTPLKDVCSYNATAWGPVLLLAGTTIIATTAYIFGKTITWQKVLQDADR